LGERAQNGDYRRCVYEVVETWSGQFKGIFDCTDRVPTRGLLATRRFVLGAVLVYYLALLHPHTLAAELRGGLKLCLRAA
jgi:hypothetical protein